MKENGVIIDSTEEGTIYFKFPNPLLEVKLTQGVSVPAHSNIVASVTISEPLENCHVLNNHSLNMSQGIFVAQGLVNVSNCNFNIFISNLTDKTKVNESGASVGRLTLAEDYTCMANDQFLNSFFYESNIKEKIKEKEGSKENPTIVEDFIKKRESNRVQFYCFR